MGDQENIKSYKDLDVWRLAIDLAETCYRLTAKFPRDEVYGMTSQIRRSAVSIAANIAEGHGRNSIAAYIQFLKIAQGSARELETHFVIAERVGLLAAEACVGPSELCERVSKMLRALIRSLELRARIQSSRNY